MGRAPERHAKKNITRTHDLPGIVKTLADNLDVHGPLFALGHALGAQRAPCVAIGPAVAERPAARQAEVPQAETARFVAVALLVKEGADLDPGSHRRLVFREKPLSKPVMIVLIPLAFCK